MTNTRNSPTARRRAGFAVERLLALIMAVSLVAMIGGGIIMTPSDPAPAAPGDADTDDDGVDDVDDLDDDNDGIPDIIECPATGLPAPGTTLLPNANFNENYVDEANPGTPYTTTARDFAPPPWGKTSTPDLSTDTQIRFDGTTANRADLAGFGPSPGGGSFMGFRSISGTSDEGLFNTLAVPNPDVEYTISFHYTEYTQNTSTATPPANDAAVDIEFRLGSISSATGVLVGKVLNLTTTGGTQGTWETRTITFTPSALGFSSPGDYNFYVGSETSAASTWAFIDVLTITAEAAGLDCDTDGDGINDHQDLDSDNDGISDLVESGQDAATVDADGNGVHDDVGETYTNGISNDANGGAGTPLPSTSIVVEIDRDGYPTETIWLLEAPSGSSVAVGASTSTDVTSDTVTMTETGTYTFRLLDSYGDGLTTGGTDPNGTNGYTITIGGLVVSSLTGPNGFGSEYTDTFTVTVSPVAGDLRDTDGDGTWDFLDLDSDGDGIPDATEARATADHVAYPSTIDDSADSDDDGILDIYDNNTTFGSTLEGFKAGTRAPNADGDDTADTVPDYRDLDSDGDGNSDADESNAPGITGIAYSDPDGSVNDPFDDADGSILLENADLYVAEVDFRSLNVAPPDPVDDTNATPFETAVGGDVSTNDSPPAGSTFTKATDPANGSVTVGTDGTYAYTPDDDFSGVDSFTYIICLPAPNATICDTATATIAVGPDAVGDGGATTVDTDLDAVVTGNDTYLTGSTFTKATDPANGSVTVDTDGSYTYTPDSGFMGVDSFTYTVCLPAPNATICDTATVTITIGPDAVDDSGTTTVDADLDGDVSGNDEYLVGSTFTKTTDPSNGTVTVNSDGTYTYSPDLDFMGVDSFTYTVCLPAPNGTLCDTATVTIVVGPVADDDAATTAHETDLDGDVTANDDSLPGSTFAKATDPSNGSVVVNSDGTYTYTPDADFTGTDSFTYTVCLPAPNGTLCDTATVTITVGPDAVDDADSTELDTDLDGDVTGNDITLAGSTFTKASDPSNGSVVVNSDGTYTYSPDADFTGTDSFTYTVCLPAPNATLCDTATVTIVVGPGALDDSGTTTVNTDLDGDVADNDTATAGSTFTKATDPSNGSVTVNSDGTYTYSPDADFMGTDTFAYTVCLPAPNAGVCDTATVTISVEPDAVNDTGTTTVDVDLDGDVTGNDTYLPGSTFTKATDPSDGSVTVNSDGTYTYSPNAGYMGTDSLTYTVCLPAPNAGVCDTATVNIDIGPDAVADTVITAFETELDGDVTGNDEYLAGSTFTKASDPSNGSVVVNSDGTYTYTPDADFTGADSFTYTVCLPAPNAALCDTATVTVLVAPDAVADTAVTAVDTDVDGDVTGNDTYPVGATFATNTDPSDGSVTVDTDGTYTYSPDAGFMSTDSFTYAVCLPAPGDSACNTATVTISIGPDAVDDTDSTTVDIDLDGDVTLNDEYLAGSTFTKASDPTNGSVVVNSDGTYTYTPDAGFMGTDTFAYTVCLPAPNGTLCDTATVAIDIEPDAVNDSGTTTVDVDLDGDVTGNDEYLAGSTFTKASDPTNGSVTVNADGSYTYSPDAGFMGTDSFTYTVCLPAPDASVCDTATVTIDIEPDAADDGATTPHETDLDGDVTANDTYLPGSTFAKTTDPSNGSVVVNSDGTYTYTPDADFTGADSFTYTVCLPAPNGTLCDTATVTIVVGPDAVNDSDSTGFDIDLDGDVTGNDTYPVGATFTKVTDPSSGSVVVDSDGTYIYSPDAGYMGTDSFTYSICLPAPNATVCDTATVTISVDPDAIDDAATTAHETDLDGDVTGNDDYLAGSTFTKASDPTNGTVVIDTDGTYTYSPDADFTGTDSFTYTVCLPAPDTGLCDTATVSVTVGPDAIADVDSTGFDTDLDGDVTGNDITLAGSTYTKATDPANGSVVVNSDGTYTYTPDTGFVGVDSFNYTVCLPAPNASLCDTATVSVTVGPDAVDDSGTTPHETDLDGDVTANDDSLPGSTFTKATDPANGSVVVNSDGTYTYTPDADFTGTDSFAYTVCLPAPNAAVCDTATVTIVVGPDAVNDSATATFETELGGDVTGNDITLAGSTFTKATDPSNGTVTVDSDGTYTYTPDAGFTGNDSFTYTVCLPAPNDTLCDTATVSITVGPDAVDDSGTTTVDVDLDADVTGNDAYPVDSTFAKATDPTNGSVVVNSDGTYTYSPDAGFMGTDSFTYTVCLPAPNAAVCDTATVSINIEPDAVNDSGTTTVDVDLDGDVTGNDDYLPGSTFTKTTDPSNGSVVVNSDGTYTYTPDAGFMGTDSFTYTVCLPAPNASLCDTATVTITVGPDAVNDNGTTTVDVDLDGDVTGNDDYLAGSTFTKASDPSNGSVVVNSDGTYTYTPDAGHMGTDSFTYTVCLPAPNTGLCDTATVSIDIEPDAVNDSGTTTVDVDLDGDVTGNDDYLAGSTFTKATDPTNGTVTVNSDGTYTYSPDAGFMGTDSFTYTVCLPAPNATLCDTATVNIDIEPDAVNDSAITPHETDLDGDVTGNDDYLAGSTFAKTTDPSNGSVVVNGDGTYTYTPDADFTGTDSFTYTVCLPAPNTGLCDTATVTITVGPDAVNDSDSTPFETAVDGNVTGNDDYLAGSTFAKTTDPSNGSVVVNSDGTYTYTPDPDFTGTDSFTYTVCLPAPDGTVCDTAMVTIVVGPDAVNDTGAATTHSAFDGDVTGNDTYPVDSTFAKATDPSNGTVTVNSDGTYTYTSDVDFMGTDSFTYTVCLPAPNATLCDTATVSLTVGPDAVNDSDTTTVDVDLDGDVTGNDEYLAGSTFTKASDPSNGSVVVNGDGTYTYSPDVDFMGTDSFTYTVCLPAPNATLCDTATVSINIEPDAVDDSGTTTVDADLDGDVTGNDEYLAGSTFTKASDPTNGSVTVNADGSYTYSPDAGFMGTDSFTYTVCLPAPDASVCDTATVTIDIEPDAADDGATTPHETDLDGDVTANDTYLPGSTFTKATDPSNGSVVVNSDGTYTYTPDADFTGTDSFTYTVCLPAPDTGLCDTATVTITVGPDAVNDSDSTGFDIDLDGDVTGNDTYPVGATFTKVTDPSSGSVTVNSDGTFTYSPDAGHMGTDSFTYTVCLPAPNSSVCDTATVTIDIEPDAVDDSATVDFDTEFDGDVTGNDDYLAGSTFAKTTDPANGTVTVNSDGTYTYSPDTGFTGADSFTYTVCLPAPNATLCDTATVQLVISTDAVADKATTPFETDVDGDVSTNDTVTPGSTFAVDTDPTNGSVTVDPDGTYTYTPDAGFTGVDTFTYTACLPAPDDGVCDTAAVTIVVGPDAIDDAAGSTPFETPVDGDASTNDTYPVGSTFGVDTDPANGSVTVDPDGTYTYTPDTGFTGSDTFTYDVCLPAPNRSVCDTATVAIVVGPDAVDDRSTTELDTPVSSDVSTNDTTPSGSTVAVVTEPTDGDVVVDPDGAYTYTPDAGFLGTDTFTYDLCLPAPDATVCDTATVVIDVAPTAVDDAAVTTYDTPVDGDVATNDVHLPGSTFTQDTPPANGTVVVNPDGTYTYTPDTGFTGSDTFTYEVCLPAPHAGLCDTATVTIVVGNDAVDDVVATPFGTPVDGDVSVNDTLQPGSTIALDTSPTNGTVVVNPDGTYTYTPDDGFTGTDAFTYEVCLPVPDADVCDTAAVTLEVGPNATDDTSISTVGTPANGDLSDNDEIPTGSTFTLDTPPANGTVVVNPDGTYTYTPDPGFVGTDTFTYEVCRSSSPFVTSAVGSPLCDTATVTITVAPNATPDISSGHAPGTTVSVDPLVNDASGVTLDPTSVELSDPATGDWVEQLTVPGQGTWSVDPVTGVVTFVPVPGFDDDPDPVEYRVRVDGSPDTVVGSNVTIEYIAVVTTTTTTTTPATTTTTPSSPLAITGSTVAPILSIALILLTAGILLVVATRRRTTASAD